MLVSVGFKPHDLSIVEKFRYLNWPLVALIMFIGGIGYAVLYSAGGGSTDPWAWRHLMRLGVGMVCMLALALIDVRFWYKQAYWIYLGALALLVAVELMGSLSKGAQRWINLGVIQLQPSELMKIALVLALARYFHSAYDDEIKRPTYLFVPLLLIVAPVILVLKQPDLGTAVTLLATGGVILFVSGVRLWKFLAAIAAAAAAAPIIWFQGMHAYQRQRVLTFLDPEADPLGAGYHIIQSKIALGSGGLWGKGFLQGTQAQLSFLPEKQTDFAFTMWAEETGFIGAILLLSLFFLVLAISLLVAYHAISHFARILAVGIAFNLFLYVMINVSMVIGLIPVVGVPLPLISYGGTAMLTVLAGFGLLLSVDIHRYTNIARFPVDL